MLACGMVLLTHGLDWLGHRPEPRVTPTVTLSEWSRIVSWLSAVPENLISCALFRRMTGGNRNPSFLTSIRLNVPASGGFATFYYHMYGATIGTLSAQTCVGTTCTTRWTASGQQHTSNSAAWSQAQFVVPGTTTNIRFVAIGGTSFTGDIAIDTVSVQAGTAPPSAAPTASPTLGSCGAVAPGAIFHVTQASGQTCVGPVAASHGACYTTSSGTCFTDGPGNYGNSESCTFQVLRSARLAVVGTLSLAYPDGFRFQGSSTLRYTTASLNNRLVLANSTFTFTSSSSTTRTGYLICVSFALPMFLLMCTLRENEA